LLNGKRRIGALAIAAIMIAGACSSAATPAPQATVAGATDTAAPSSVAATPGAVNCVTGSITAAGSTALQPLVDAAAKQYVAACSGATINVQGGGSGTGLSQVSAGAVQIGDSDVTAASKLATPDANKLVDHIVTRQGWIMVLNPGVTGVTNLTTAQATDIWTGKTTNWKDVGGPDMPIVLVIRPASSGTRATFRKIVLGGQAEAAGQAITQDSNDAVTQAVTQTDGATSVIGFAYFQANKAKLTGIQLDGVDATVANMSNGSYKLAADGHMYTNGQPSGLAAAFLDYMMSPAIQGTLIPSLFYAPVVG
jgi:phosphate transport system substrate-binding protein